jgi:DNA-binding IscR family transcriptional regulator
MLFRILKTKTNVAFHLLSFIEKRHSQHLRSIKELSAHEANSLMPKNNF